MYRSFNQLYVILLKKIKFRAFIKMEYLLHTHKINSLGYSTLLMFIFQIKKKTYIWVHGLIVSLHILKYRYFQTSMALTALIEIHACSEITLSNLIAVTQHVLLCSSSAQSIFRSRGPPALLGQKATAHCLSLMHILKVTPVEIKATKILLYIRESCLFFLKEIKRNPSLPNRLRLALFIYQNIKPVP